jgi:hypothetical protein
MNYPVTEKQLIDSKIHQVQIKFGLTYRYWPDFTTVTM